MLTTSSAPAGAGGTRRLPAASLHPWLHASAPAGAARLGNRSTTQAESFRDAGKFSGLREFALPARAHRSLVPKAYIRYNDFMFPALHSGRFVVIAPRSWRRLAAGAAEMKAGQGPITVAAKCPTFLAVGFAIVCDVRSYRHFRPPGGYVAGHFGGRLERGAFSFQPSAVSHQPSAISHQLSAVSHQLSAVSYQLSAISHQHSSLSFTHSPFTPSPPHPLTPSRHSPSPPHSLTPLPLTPTLSPAEPGARGPEHRQRASRASAGNLR